MGDVDPENAQLIQRIGWVEVEKVCLRSRGREEFLLLDGPFQWRTKVVGKWLPSLFFNTFFISTHKKENYNNF